MAPAAREPDTIAVGTVRLLLSYVVTAGFTAIVTFYLVRTLGPREFGLFSLALGIGSLLAFFADFGLAASAARYLAERRGDREAAAVTFAAALRLKLLLAGAVAVLSAALAGPIEHAYDAPGLAWTLRAMSVAVFLQSTITLFSRTFIAVGRTQANLRMIAIESAAECGATILLVVATGGAAAAAWGRAVGYAIGVGVGVGIVIGVLGRRALAMHRREGAPAMGRYAGALMIVDGTYLLFSNIDLLLIGAILSTGAVGAFAAPLRISALLQYPGLAIGNAVGPRAARRPDAPPDFEAVQQALRLLIILGAGIAAFVLVWARPIVDLALGDDYGKSVDVLRAMCPFLFIQGLAVVLSLSVNYLGEARRRVPVAIAALAVNALIDLLLLEPLGVVAAAIGTSAGYTVYTVGHFIICRRLMNLRLGALAVTTARALVAAEALAAVLLAFGDAQLGVAAWVLGTVGGAVAFVAVLRITGEFTLGELRALRAG
jgi:O-antigen/teichoic acid export membrane protein